MDCAWCDQRDVEWDVNSLGCGHDDRFKVEYDECPLNLKECERCGETVVIEDGWICKSCIEKDENEEEENVELVMVEDGWISEEIEER